MKVHEYDYMHNMENEVVKEIRIYGIKIVSEDDIRVSLLFLNNCIE